MDPLVLLPLVRLPFCQPSHHSYPCSSYLRRSAICLLPDDMQIAGSGWRKSSFIPMVKNGKDDNGDLVRSNSTYGFIFSTNFWLQAAVVIVTLGFIDAGYSGDWTRIGVLSTEAESALRLAAYGVVPLSAALIWFISQRKDVQ